MATTLSLPAGPPPPYHAPAPHHAAPYKIPPRPFAYAYGVADEYSGTNFDKKETQVHKIFKKVDIRKADQKMGNDSYFHVGYATKIKSFATNNKPNFYEYRTAHRWISFWRHILVKVGAIANGGNIGSETNGRFPMKNESQIS